MLRKLAAPMFAPLVLAGLAACGGGGGGTSPGSSGGGGGAPPPVQNATLAPYYTGTEVANGVSVPIALYVSQNNSNFTGTWGNEAAGIANVGTLVGTVQGSSVSGTFTSSIVLAGAPIGCPTTVKGTVAASTISGNFSTGSNCNAPESGTFTAKQAPAPTTFSAKTHGTLSDSLAGSGTIYTTLEQIGVVLQGKYNTTFATGGPGTSGQMYAVVMGSDLYIDLVPSQSGSCSFSGIGTISGTSVSGNYTAQSCSASDSGTFSFTSL